MGFVPAYAGVGDALTVDKLFAGDQLLGSCDEVAFEHDAHDALVAAGDLACDVAADGGLLGVVLVAVGVAAVDHDARWDAGLFHLAAGFFDRCGVVVDGLAAAAKDDVAVRVAVGDEDGGLAVFGVAEECVRVACGHDGFDGDLYIAGGSVFEADWAGEPGD